MSAVRHQIINAHNITAKRESALNYKKSLQALKKIIPGWREYKKMVFRKQ